MVYYKWVKEYPPKKMSIASTGEKCMENYYIANEKYDSEYIKSTWGMATGLSILKNSLKTFCIKGNIYCKIET